MSMLKLDLYQYYYFDKKPRFSKTRALLFSKKKHLKDNIKNPEKTNKKFLIPLGLQLDVAEKEVEAIKREVFEKKIHYSLVEFQRALKKVRQSKKKFTDDDQEFLKTLDLEKLSKSRIIKIVSKIFNLKDLERNSFITEQWILDGHKDKKNELNPSFFFESLDKTQKNTLSKVFNNKEFKKVSESVELRLKLILGPVVSKKTDTEVKKSEKEKGDKIQDESDESDDEENEDFSDDDLNNAEDGETGEFNEEYFAQFDSLVGDSEGEEDDQNELDAGIDYNQVTDEEPSDFEDDEELSLDDEKDDFFVEEIVSKKDKKDKKDKTEKKEKKEKHKLPELAVGYYSGGEDEDDFKPSKDKLVEKITKPERKNRRGQRERQRIWELKYGKSANHVQKERDVQMKEREKKQKEWEERERKRKQKAMDNGEYASGGNSTPLGSKGNKSDTNDNKPLHPSWEAKMKQKQLSNVKFEGKKKTFD